MSSIPDLATPIHGRADSAAGRATYARARLKLGITAVGTTVLLASAAGMETVEVRAGVFLGGVFADISTLRPPLSSMRRPSALEPEEWAGRLDEAFREGELAGRLELRGQLEALLAAENAAGDFLESGPARLAEAALAIRMPSMLTPAYFGSSPPMRAARASASV